ncbi:MAG: hypothetical protein ACU0C9_08185 [Paracoccaceae bacterium]
MPNHGGRKGSVEDLLPDDRRELAEGIWKERDQIASPGNVAWIIREAAKPLGLAAVKHGIGHCSSQSGHLTKTLR